MEVAPGSAATGFVGRERELAALDARLADARAGAGSIALLAGEPGIGKTRLAEELAAAAAAQGVRALWGRCYEGEGAPAFWPWLQITRAYVRDRDPKALRTEMGPGAADIAQVVAEVRERLPGLPDPPVIEPEQARFRFFDSLTAFLCTAERQPLLLILDDLHWADRPSLLLLQFLAREVRRSRLLVLGTYRHLEVGRQHALAQTLALLARAGGSERIDLKGLSEHDVARFIEIIGGLTPPAALVAAVFQETEGNPFFVREVVRLLRDQLSVQGAVNRGRDARDVEPGTSSLELVGVPPTVRAVIGQRLDSLSEPCWSVLTIGAVAGREFGLNLVERVSGLARGQLLDVLEEAEMAGVIVPARAPGRYSFAHALLRESLYEDLPTTRRVRLHLQAGQALAELYGAEDEPHLPELAHHFFQAAPGGAEERARAYALRAAERAMRLLAYEEAAGHYEHALQALALRPPVDEGQRCELLLALGGARARAGESERAREVLDQAAALAQRLGDARRLAHAALAASATAFEYWRVDRPLVALLEEALAALGEQDGALRARLMSRLASALYYAGDAERCTALSREAVALARRAGDPAALASVLTARLVSGRGPDHIQERLAIAAELLEMAAQAGSRQRALHAHRYRMVDLLHLGDIAGVEAEIAAQARLADELRQPVQPWWTMTYRAMLALLQGQFAEGERLIDDALALGRRVQEPNAHPIWVAQTYLLARERGTAQTLELVFRGYVERYTAGPAWRCGLANLYAELGREADARREFESLAEHGFAALHRDPADMLFALTLLAEVCAFLGDAPRAATMYDLMLPYAGQNVIASGGWLALGSTARYLGLLAATVARAGHRPARDGWWDRAQTQLEAALAFNARMGARHWLARTEQDYAILLLDRHDAACARVADCGHASGRSGCCPGCSIPPWSWA